MALGTYLAREDAPEHAAMMDLMKEQMLIVLLKRLGGKVSIPVAELDDTGMDMVTMRLDDDDKVFHFTVIKKN